MVALRRCGNNLGAVFDALIAGLGAQSQLEMPHIGSVIT